MHFHYKMGERKGSLYGESLGRVLGVILINGKREESLFFACVELMPT